MRSDHPRQLEHAAVATGVLKRPEVRRLCLLGKVKVNNKRARTNDHLEPGDEITIHKSKYEVISGGEDRLGMRKLDEPPFRINTPVKVHCGYHKCLTMYSRKIYRRASTSLTLSPAIFKKNASGFRHFFHRKDVWLDNYKRYGMSSLSGHAINLDQFHDIKVIRFIRDPRDLIISGYFYHKRGGEHWCHYKNPTTVDFDVVNGVAPAAVGEGITLMDYLNEASIEEGLAAEIEFRKKHFESMMEWPEDDDRIKLYRYEDILGSEPETFEEIFTFLNQPKWITKRAVKNAKHFRAGGKEVVKGHVRNPNSQQWRKYFTPELNKKFVEQYEPLLLRHGYPLD